MMILFAFASSLASDLIRNHTHAILLDIRQCLTCCLMNGCVWLKRCKNTFVLCEFVRGREMKRERCVLISGILGPTSMLDQNQTST